MDSICHHQAQVASLIIFLPLPADPQRQALLYPMANFGVGLVPEALHATLAIPLGQLPQPRQAVVSWVVLRTSERDQVEKQ